ncbi:MAG TPA: transposase [Ktedonobacteraceae bacterium]
MLPSQAWVLLSLLEQTPEEKNWFLGRSVGAVGVHAPIHSRLLKSRPSKAQSNGRPNTVASSYVPAETPAGPDAARRGIRPRQLDAARIPRRLAPGNPHANTLRAMPDLSWASREAGRFDQSQFLIDWPASQAICPAGHTSRDWLQIPDRHGKPSLRVRFPLAVCRPCPLHAQCTSVAAKVLRLRPDEATNTALVAARKRQETPAFWKQYATRARIEGTVAQAVRICEMRRARYIGLKKLRLQAFFTATAINMLRACAWLANGTHDSTSLSRFARLVSAGKAVAA